MSDARIVVLLPTYNEAGNLRPMLDAIHAQVPRADVLVIDDDSPDGTGRMADEVAAKAGHVKVAHRPPKQGLGVAYRFGYRWALDHGYHRVLQIDCDFSHDPKDLPRIVDLLEAHPAVVGSRRVPGGGSDGWPWYRNLISGAGSLYARAVLSSPVRDLTTGFKGFRDDALRRLNIENLRTDGFGFQIEVTTTLLALGVPVHEMPIRFSDRAVGKSKMSTKIFLEAMWKVWDIRKGARKTRARS
jgi:dolichol-phosphate mannosyltransferase